jgi:dynein heavy chain
MFHLPPYFVYALCVCVCVYALFCSAVVRSNWTRVCERVDEVTSSISQLQVRVRKQLIADVRAFKAEASAFCADLRAGGLVGPGGLLPADVADRLRRAEDEVDIRARKKQVFCSGEELFAMPPTAYPDLDALVVEIGLVSKLHSLTRDVNNQLESWGGQAWADIVSSPEILDQMAAATRVFAERCTQLPTHLKSW